MLLIDRCQFHEVDWCYAMKPVLNVLINGLIYFTTTLAEFEYLYASPRKVFFFNHVQ